MKTLHSDQAPKAIGPYSVGVQSGNLLFLSGQIALDPATMNIVGEDIALQTEQVCKNIQAVVESAGCTLSDVVKTTIYLTDMADFAKVNEIYGQYFAHKPARSTIGVASLPRGARVEIECIVEV